MRERFVKIFNGYDLTEIENDINTHISENNFFLISTSISGTVDHEEPELTYYAVVVVFEGSISVQE